MSGFSQLLARLFGTREPTHQERLAAHIDALAQGVEERPAGASAHPSLPTFSEDPFRVVVESGFSRIEIHCPRGRVHLRIMADSFLGQPRFDDDVRPLLQEHGFTSVDGEPHFDWTASYTGKADARRVAAHVETMLEGACGHAPGSFYSVCIERSRKAHNSDLIQAIRKLAKSQDFESRRVVYQEVVNATLIVALVPSPRKGLLPPTPDSTEPELNGRDVWSAFTDAEALQNWRADPQPHLLCSGYRLIQAALRSKVGALRINPGSRIGGELYANELRMIADAIRIPT